MLFGKYLAYLVCTTLLVLPSVVIVYFVIIPLGGASIGSEFPALASDLGMLILGLAAYGALFAFVGARFKRPIVMGLVFAFGWEQMVLLMPGYLKRFTLAYYLQGVVPHAMPSDGVVSLLQSVFREVPSALTSLFWLLFALVASLVLATRVVERREYVLAETRMPLGNWLAFGECGADQTKGHRLSPSMLVILKRAKDRLDCILKVGWC